MHETYIKQCLDLSKQAVEKGNHPFGALLLKEGKVILTAQNTVETENDRTRHAELNLVSLAEQTLSKEDLQKSILYTSTEPCPMCCGAIYWSDIEQVVYGCSGAKLGEIAGDKIALSAREIFAQGKRNIKVIGPVLEEEAAQQHHDFW